MTDADRCADIVRRHARTFSMAAALLPREKRRGAFALYAFCRDADDIVDRATEDTPVVAQRLRAYGDALDAALGGNASTPVFRELQWAVAHFDIPHAPLRSVLDGVASDLAPTPYETWDALTLYCANVASSVGELCTHVFGVEGGARTRDCALERARLLGLAMQLTNILRDVGEDAARGRCYLPVQDLAAFGITRDDVLTDRRIASRPAWRALMRFEIARARRLYDDAEPGIALLASDARQCATACARGYAMILGAIERQAYDTISTRAVVPSWRKATVLWNAWRLHTA